MKATLEAINQMQADGVIAKYAIDGAVGATFYLEPAATIDLDVFVTLPTTARGGRVEDEYIVIGGWPVQFLPPSNDLEREAIAESVAITLEGVNTWVMKPEHLVAIALRTGRSKDHIRILQFTEQGSVDRGRLKSVLDRHGLTSKWEQFERKYLGGHP